MYVRSVLLTCLPYAASQLHSSDSVSPTARILFLSGVMEGAGKSGAGVQLPSQVWIKRPRSCLTRSSTRVVYVWRRE